MLAKWEEGYDIVYMLRKEDKSLSLFKRTTSRFFYAIINFLSDIKLEEGAADFRLLDRKVLMVFKNNLHESHIFLRGLINWVGFKTYAIQFVPDKRHSGKTKYSVKKMTNFAIDGITSFSTKPLRIAILIGFLLAFFSFCYGVYAIIMYFIDKSVKQGWTSTILSIMFVGGIIIFILGIIGEYIGKIYFEVKKRPRFIIRESNYE
jgi:polyisoprenyl-phosphate glycosyltransferase